MPVAGVKRTPSSVRVCHMDAPKERWDWSHCNLPKGMPAIDMNDIKLLAEVVFGGEEFNDALLGGARVKLDGRVCHRGVELPHEL